MPPRGLEIEFPHQRDTEGVAEDRYVHLREPRPNLVGSIGVDVRHDQARRAGVVQRGESEGVAVVDAADRRFHGAGRHVEQRTVEFDALFVDRHPLVEAPQAFHIFQRGSGVALELGRVAEQV